MTLGGVQEKVTPGVIDDPVRSTVGVEQVIFPDLEILTLGLFVFETTDTTDFVVHDP